MLRNSATVKNLMLTRHELWSKEIKVDFIYPYCLQIYHKTICISINLHFVIIIVIEPFANIRDLYMTPW